MARPHRLRNGHPPRIVTVRDIEVMAWHRAKQHVGTYKSKAHELGIEVGELMAIIKYMGTRSAVGGLTTQPNRTERGTM